MVQLGMTQLLSSRPDSKVAVQAQLQAAPGELSHANKARLTASAYGWLKAEKVGIA